MVYTEVLICLSVLELILMRSELVLCIPLGNSIDNEQPVIRALQRAVEY
jgi:hypothetical protein